MNNYEAVKPLNKTEDLVNRQSKKAPPCVTESFSSVLLSKHKHSKTLVPRAVGRLFEGKPVHMFLGTAVSARESYF